MSLLDMHSVLAMASPPGGSGQGQGGGFLMIGYMLVIFGLFYFLMIRPQMKKEKERKALIEAIKTGDRILFSGGILGTVSNTKPDTFTVKIAENVKIDIARGAVIRVLDKDEQIKAEDTKSA
jgi:preprotein translocase subunit YajC